MDRKIDRNDTLIAIVFVMVLFIILAGWADGRMAGVFYVKSFNTEITLAETINVYEYELVYHVIDNNIVLGTEETESEEYDIEEEYRKVPKIDIPAGSTSRVSCYFEFYNMRNPDGITISKASYHTIRTNYKISDDKLVRVVYTDDNKLLQSPGNYVNISKLESYSDIISAYDEALDNWFDHWHKCQITGVLIALAVAGFIAFIFFIIRRTREDVQNSTLFGFSVAIIIMCVLDLLFVLAYFFPNMR